MVHVTAGIIRQGERILIARRRPGLRMAGLWEFPGGTIEAGETPEECLRRELSEELGIHVRVGRCVGQTEHDYPRGRICLHFYEVEHLEGDVSLRDHDRFAWVASGELGAYTFAPADVPFVQRLMEGCGVL